MLSVYIKATETLKQLRADARGVVSFEYIIVAACIIATVSAVFLSTGSTGIIGALNTGVGKVATALGNAIP